jgi:hypothetical protein
MIKFIPSCLYSSIAGATYERLFSGDFTREKLFVALGAVLRFLHVKGLFAIVALAAKSPLGDLGHIHFIGTLRHLEHLIVATRTLQTFAFYMYFMTENYLRCPFRPKGKIAAPNHLGARVKGKHHAEHKTDRKYLFHSPTPFRKKIWTAMLVDEYSRLREHPFGTGRRIIARSSATTSLCSE